MKYWFRICFERECEDEEDAEYFINELTDKIWDKSVDELTYDKEKLEEKQKKFVPKEIGE